MGTSCAKPTDTHIFLVEDKKIKTKKILAQGGYGYVYLAEDLASKKKYALKVICLPDYESKMMFLKEIEVMRILGDHPNIIKMYSAQQKQQFGFILMERAKYTLWQKLAATALNQISQNQIIFILREVSSGLKFLHSKGIAHRDIKSQNILIMPDGNVCICDFGSSTNDFINSKNIPKQQIPNYQKQSGKYTTGLYKPPELINFQLGYRIDQKMDMWMLGCLAYVLVFYQPPFKGQNSQIIAAKIKIPVKVRVSKQLIDLIVMLLRPNPKQRPTASETLKYLNSFAMLRSTSSGNSSK